MHAQIRLTVRDIRHDLTETEKSGVNYIAHLGKDRSINRWKE